MVPASSVEGQHRLVDAADRLTAGGCGQRDRPLGRAAGPLSRSTETVEPCACAARSSGLPVVRHAHVHGRVAGREATRLTSLATLGIGDAAARRRVPGRRSPQLLRHADRDRGDRRGVHHAHDDRPDHRPSDHRRIPTRPSPASTCPSARAAYRRTRSGRSTSTRYLPGAMGPLTATATPGEITSTVIPSPVKNLGSAGAREGLLDIRRRRAWLHARHVEEVDLL